MVSKASSPSIPPCRACLLVIGKPQLILFFCLQASSRHACTETSVSRLPSNITKISPSSFTDAKPSETPMDECGCSEWEAEELTANISLLQLTSFRNPILLRPQWCCGSYRLFHFRNVLKSQKRHLYVFHNTGREISNVRQVFPPRKEAPRIPRRSPIQNHEIWHGEERLTNTLRPQLSATVAFDLPAGRKAKPLYRHDDIYFVDHPLDIAVEVWAIWNLGDEEWRWGLVLWILFWGAIDGWRSGASAQHTDSCTI
jgi:hypothetical protein